LPIADFRLPNADYKGKRPLRRLTVSGAIDNMRAGRETALLDAVRSG
jgi:hypothetical protein